MHVFPDLAGVQRRIYDRLLVLRFPVSEFSLWPRIAKTFVDAPPPFSQEVIEIFTKKAKPHALQCFYRSCMNGLPTTARLHIVDTRPCIFGCVGSKDEFAHYWVSCPRLHEAMSANGCRIVADPCLYLACIYTIYTSCSRLPSPISARRLREFVIAARKAHTTKRSS